MTRYPMRPIATNGRRAQLGPAELRLLDDWGKALRETFPDAWGPYLVGSTMQGKADWRDVDVRVLLDDDAHAALAAVIQPRRLNLMLTLWGRQVTGLPIDCQVQPRSLANKQYPSPKHPRNPLGVRGSEGIGGA